MSISNTRIDTKIVANYKGMLAGFMSENNIPPSVEFQLAFATALEEVASQIRKEQRAIALAAEVEQDIQTNPYI